MRPSQECRQNDAPNSFKLVPQNQCQAGRRQQHPSAEYATEGKTLFSHGVYLF